MLVQRPIRTKKRPNFGFPNAPKKGELGEGKKGPGGPFNRKIWKSLTPEQREKLKKSMNEVRDGFDRVLHNMPKALYLILRYLRICYGVL